MRIVGHEKCSVASGGKRDNLIDDAVLRRASCMFGVAISHLPNLLARLRVDDPAIIVSFLVLVTITAAPIPIIIPAGFADGVNLNFHRSLQREALALVTVIPQRRHCDNRTFLAIVLPMCQRLFANASALTLNDDFELFLQISIVPIIVVVIKNFVPDMLHRVTKALAPIGTPEVLIREKGVIDFIVASRQLHFVIDFAQAATARL